MTLSLRREESVSRRTAGQDGALPVLRLPHAEVPFPGSGWPGAQDGWRSGDPLRAKALQDLRHTKRMTPLTL